MDEDLSDYFLGSFEHKLDAKGRISLPSAFRETLRRQGSPSEFVIIPKSSRKPCLTGLSREGHNRLIRKLKNTSFSSVEQKEAARNFYIARALEISIEDTGRFVLNAGLREQIDMEKGGNVMFVADGSAFEIWAMADYDAHRARLAEPEELIAVGEL